MGRMGEQGLEPSAHRESLPLESLPLESAHREFLPLESLPLADRPMVLIDQDPETLDHLAQVLEALGYGVVVARSRGEAWDKMQRFQPLGIFLNLSLSAFVDAHWQQFAQISGIQMVPVLTASSAPPEPLPPPLSPRLPWLLLPLPTTPTQLKAHLQGYGHRQGWGESPVEPAARAVPQLTLLCLRGETGGDEIPREGRSSHLPQHLTKIFPQHRILEAQDLEQADLLTRIWNPHVLLLDTSTCQDPQGYVQDLGQYAALVDLPTVTFDHGTTAAANQIPGLAVFPCLGLGLGGSQHSLAPTSQQVSDLLLPVIQLAASCDRPKASPPDKPDPPLP